MLRPSPPLLAVDPKHPFVSFIVMHFSLWRTKVSEYRLMVAIAVERKISEKCHYQNITNIHAASICVKQDLLPQSNSVYCVWRKKASQCRLYLYSSLYSFLFFCIYARICIFLLSFRTSWKILKKKTAVVQPSFSDEKARRSLLTARRRLILN